MSFDVKKTILLEKQYLYVRASKGFQLEGMSTERIWTNTGYYRFLVSNVADALGNSYVNIWYDSSDVDFIAYCSDLFMEELQNSIVVAIENIQTYLENFADTNHDDIETFSENVGTALGQLYDEVHYTRNSLSTLINNQGKSYNYDVSRIDRADITVSVRENTDGLYTLNLDSVFGSTGTALLVIKYTGASGSGDMKVTCTTSEGVYSLYSDKPMDTLGNNVASSGHDIVFTSNVGSLVQNSYYVFKIVGFKVA